MSHIVKIKRVYDEPAPDDGWRILVDRLWPRGISKEKLQMDQWMKELAPTHDLRKWFQHDPQKFPVFKERYRLYLKENQESLEKLKELKGLLKNNNVTLLYSAKEERHNQAAVLQEMLLEEC
ncbi:DUF488 domain-containing protein [Siminovitchia sediminis]|uniref:DUF488 domain-containing protein n=1 Tax=Siminovitchia sediminis TaxID=1274353 RepID=A0ABW4KCP7_9BACI